jgi:integrase
MAILAQCSTCRNIQSVKNKKCKCGENLIQAKRSQRVKYWIQYRLPGGKQRKEYVGSFKDLNGYSIEDARVAENKRMTQKKENRLMDIKPDAKMTFRELTEWFLSLEKVKTLSYYGTLQYLLNNFNAVFEDTIVGQIKPADLENYQAKRKNEGLSDSYIDQHIGAARTMINKAFDNDLVGGDVLRTFKKVKKLLKRNANARDRVLSLDEYHKLFEKLPFHTKGIVAAGYYTGMRKGEILNLTWDKVDLKNRVISLEPEDTKDREPRKIPICDELYEALKKLPRAIHDSHVFLYAGKPVRDIRDGLKKACKDAGILYGRNVKSGFIFHDLRHTFNTNMRKAGVPESVIMDITGHSTREMFDRYNKVDMDDTRQAVNQMQNYLENRMVDERQLG